MTLKKYTDSDLSLVESLLTEEEKRFLLDHGIPRKIMSMSVLEQPEIIDQTNVVLYRRSPNERIGFRDDFIFIDKKSREIMQSNETLSEIPMFNNNLVNTSLPKLIETNEVLFNWLNKINWPTTEVIDYEEYERFKEVFLSIDTKFSPYWFNIITNLEMYAE